MSASDKNTRPAPEPVQVVKQRRDRALQALVSGIPYVQFLGIEFDRRGDELTATLRYDPTLIGNPLLPAIHGGATAAFLETAAIIERGGARGWSDGESGALDVGWVTAQSAARGPRRGGKSALKTGGVAVAAAASWR